MSHRQPISTFLGIAAANLMVAALLAPLALGLPPSPQLGDWNEDETKLDGTQAGVKAWRAQPKARREWNCYNYAVNKKTTGGPLASAAPRWMWACVMPTASEVRVKLSAPPLKVPVNSPLAVVPTDGTSASPLSVAVTARLACPLTGCVKPEPKKIAPSVIAIKTSVSRFIRSS